MEKRIKYFKAYSEPTFIKINILNKRNEADAYLQKYDMIVDECDFNKRLKLNYIAKFKAAVKAVYRSIQPFIENIKNPDNYKSLKNINAAKNLEEFEKIFELLNAALYDLGISDLTISDEIEPEEAIGG